MKRTASEYIRHLELRVARLERKSSVMNHLAFAQAVSIARKVKIRREADINRAVIIALQRGGAPQSDYIKLMEDIGMSWKELDLFYADNVSKAVHDIVHHLNADNVAMLAVHAILTSIPEGSVPKQNAIKRLNRLNIGDGTAEYESFIDESESSNIRSAMRGHRQAFNRLPPGESPVKLDSRVKSNLERQTRDRVSNYETLDMGLGKYEKNYLVKVNFSGSSEPLFAIVVQDRINKVQSSFFSGTDYNKMQKLFNDKFKK